ncbi:MAG TPA: thioredoxin [Sulfurovum sp.]|nr:thioredoxin [Sulfurovum sp.]
MAIVEVDEESFEEALQSAFDKKDTVIIKFGSEYCEPCHALECELEELDEEMDNVSILMVDTAESQDLAEQYDVFELPTMIIYKDSETVIYHKEGVILAPDIEKIIKEN